METKTPSHLLITDGQYAQGKRIQVALDGQPDSASETVLSVFEVMSKIQRPGDKITVECRSVSTRESELTTCQVSLTKDSDDSVSNVNL